MKEKGDYVRIRLTEQFERKLAREQQRTGRSFSEIVRQALAEYFRENERRTRR